MSATAPLEKLLLKLFAGAKEHSFSTTDLKKKFGQSTPRSPKIEAEADEIDRAITALIDSGKMKMTKVGKIEHHPRSGGSYQLTAAGKDHARPNKPDASNETLEAQEAFILLQFLRVKHDKDASMTRSELNEKLKTKSASQYLEFVEASFKEVLDYHLHKLVQVGSLTEQRHGISSIFKLTDSGREALGASKQYDSDNFTFTFTGFALNALLEAARDSSTKHHAKADHHAEEPQATPEPIHHVPTHKSPDLDLRQIHNLIVQLKADKYAGRDLIPIHEVRSLVAQHQGAEAASHPVFDPLVNQLRTEGRIRLVAISNNQDATPTQLEEAIPGMNETLFYIVVK